MQHPEHTSLVKTSNDNIACNTLKAWLIHMWSLITARLPVLILWKTGVSIPHQFVVVNCRIFTRILKVTCNADEFSGST